MVCRRADNDCRWEYGNSVTWHLEYRMSTLELKELSHPSGEVIKIASGKTLDLKSQGIDYFTHRLSVASCSASY